MPFDGYDRFEPLRGDLDVLIRARTRIATGWVQGQYQRHDGAVCTVGAIALTMSNGENRGQLLTKDMRRVVRLLSREVPRRGVFMWTIAWIMRHKTRVIWFNDSYYTSQAKVIRLYDNAIDRLRRREAHYPAVTSPMFRPLQFPGQ